MHHALLRLLEELLTPLADALAEEIATVAGLELHPGNLAWGEEWEGLPDQAVEQALTKGGDVRPDPGALFGSGRVERDNDNYYALRRHIKECPESALASGVANQAEAIPVPDEEADPDRIARGLPGAGRQERSPHLLERRPRENVTAPPPSAAERAASPSAISSSAISATMPIASPNPARPRVRKRSLPSATANSRETVATASAPHEKSANCCRPRRI